MLNRFSKNLPWAGLAFALSLVLSAQAIGSEVNLTDPNYPLFHANAMDQPRLKGVLTDGQSVIAEDGKAVVFTAFIDTGSSGFVLSNLHVDPEAGAGYLGLGPTDYLGEYTNLGLGGEEVGWVTRPFGVHILNQPEPTDGEGEVALNEFGDYGSHRLWVRQEAGIGESGTIIGISPVNIVGMPVIKQRVMVMEWFAPPEEFAGIYPENLTVMETRLLPVGDPGIPPANITLDLAMVDFTGEPDEGEIYPSFARNPVVSNVTITHNPDRPSVTGNWLYDTGAGSSFVSFDWAQEIGLISESYETLEEYVVDHRAANGIVSQVGGIGPEAIYVPILDLSEIRIPAQEGFDVVWNNVRILIFDHPELAALGIKGIFGMNLLSPAATLDASLLEGVGLEDAEGVDPLILALLLDLLSDVSPGPFQSVSLHVTGEETAELQLYSSRVTQISFNSFAEWQQSHFSPEDLNDESVSGPTADPEGFGIPNLMRYALKLNPDAPDHQVLPSPQVVENNGEKHLSFTYQRSTAAKDIDFLIETSTDLVTWTPATDLDVEVSSAGNQTTVTARDPNPLSASAPRFLRLRLTLLSPP